MKITCILVDRANYGRLQPVLDLLESADWCELTVICGGTTVIPRFGAMADQVAHAGVNVYHEVEGSCGLSMAKSVGLGVLEYTTAISESKPHLVLMIGDRYEALGAAVAAHYLRVPILHLQGGEVSGTLDDGARRAITQLARWHVPATTTAVNNLMKQGVKACDILAVGCPSADVAAQIKPTRTDGPILVVYHPDTDSDADKRAEIRAVLDAVGEYSVDILWPNIDAGSDVVAAEIKQWLPEHPKATVYTNLSPTEFHQKLAETWCCVGNSSSFVRDAGFFGTPVVLTGTRQKNREYGKNVRVIHPRCTFHAASIRLEINGEVGKRYPTSTLYGKPGISQQIVEAIYENIGNHTSPRELATAAG